MKSFDVIIVGGGPAGSSCAWQLRQAGLNALVVDSKPFPRDKPCAGWITPQVVDALQLNLEQYRRGRVCQSIRGFRCGTIGGRDAVARYDKTVSYGIRRSEFDAYLLERTGAVCRLGHPVSTIERNANRWRVNGSYSAPMLVGAGGNFCPVARLLGARGHSGTSMVVAKEIEFRPTCEESAGNLIDAEIPELYFCRDLRGYGWCFRKGDYLNIGLGRLEAKGLSEHVAHFCTFLRDRGRICGDIEGRFVGHAYQLYEHEEPTLLGDGVLLVGDSAGLAYPQSGEGIRPAVESGLIAADVILGCENGYSASQLAGYRSRLLSRFGQPGRQRAISWLPAAWLHRVAWQLLATRWFSRHVVMDRWFLHRKQAALST